MATISTHSSKYIVYGLHSSPFGECLIATGDRGICHLAFTLGNAQLILARWRASRPNAEWIEHSEATASLVRDVFDKPHSAVSMNVDLHGTPFQMKVWNELRQIPRGHVTSYGELAVLIGYPTASRAVGTAVGDNPIAVLVPCHRVLRKDGTLGGYAYGTDIKSALLRWEGALR